MPKRFNIRVYGILRNQRNEILVSDERRHDASFTKFPGGGLEFGEGLVDCLKRELYEELNYTATIGSQYYVNDFFQQSDFRTEEQLLSFYFNVAVLDDALIPTSEHPIPMVEDGEAFRWVRISALNPEEFTFPIDKVVAEKLASETR